MNRNRKKLVKARLAERRKFYDELNRMNRLLERVQKERLRLEPNTFRVTFSFSPSELGINCNPTPESIERLGIQRALERVSRKDFYVNVPVIGQGKPTPENLEGLRNKTLQETLAQLSTKKSHIDLSSFAAVGGDTNESQSGPDRTT